MLRGDALLAPVQPRGGARGEGWDPDEVVLLPLYPQYSTTTTGSSLTAWREAAAQAGLAKPVTTLCCYHSDPASCAPPPPVCGSATTRPAPSSPAGAAAGAVLRARPAGDHRQDGRPLPVPDGAHGRRRGARAGDARTSTGRVCYQSRATPQKWIDPSTEDEIERAAHDKVAVLVVPIAFVSEHSETLVELDVEYREMAEKLACRATSGRRRRTATPASSPRWPSWCAARWAADRACAASWAAAPARARTAIARMPAPVPAPPGRRRCATG